MKKQKKLIRLANMVLEAVCGLQKQHLRQIQSNLEDFCKKYGEASKDSHLFYAAVERNWTGSAEKIRARIGRNLNDFSYHLQRFKETINADIGKQPKLSGIFAEFNQIARDIGELQFDLKEKTISVITDPISLDDISFGSFEIKLNISEIRKLYTESPYSVIALEPNPAGSDSNVTHPHVSSEKLCEGDGHTAIRRSLEDGRLCDFFTMIVNILQTYNPDSPYVSLDDWEGISCYDCGYTVAGDECYYCEYCERDYCSQCSSYCQMCDTTICLGCAYECPSCNEPVCKSCTAACKECEETFCKDCLTEEGLCQSCEENRKEKQDEEQKEESTEPKASSAVQPNSVGEAIVHA
jgi:hypothetical protein